ncbi:T9SS type A sorting domain-containing protein [Polaribacter sp. R77954]|uniref:T9SS type A sorting domain-containing protein n=1 Tax=Polaribacter sp. R77954 TaxID=3093870 RepID=UPI0037CA7AF8
MKKITFILITFLSLSTFSQSWDFTNDAEGWTASAVDMTVNANSITLTTKDGANNPTIVQAAANVDANALSIIAVTLKVSANGPTYMRAHFPKAAGGRVYKPVAITNGLSDFKTFYIDLTNGDWTGTVNDVKVQFKDDNGTNGGANHTSTGETIEIDKIEFLSEIPKEEIVSFDFDTDDQGWTTIDAATSVSNGAIIITPEVDGAAKIVNNITTIDATKYKFIEVKYKNLSADNDQIRFQFRHAADSYTAYKGKNTSMNVSSSDFETLEIDLSETTEWTGNTQDFQLIIRDVDNENKASAGNLEIDAITFKETSTLSIDKINIFNDVLVYPNPSNGIVNIKSNISFAKIELFSILGKKVFETTSIQNNQIDVSHINAGVYLLRLLDNNNKTKTKKLIIN